MARGPLDKFEHPDLPAALSWLRARQRLTQKDVANGVADSGASLSASYYAEVERGRSAPSKKTLAAVLTALGSDETELAGILETKPWQQQSFGSPSYRVTKSTPRMMRGLATPEAAIFGAQVDDAGAQAFAMADLADIAPPPTSSRVHGEIAELSDIYQQLGPGDRATVLGVARRLDRRRS